jgi:hypothetical protein
MPSNITSVLSVSRFGWSEVSPGKVGWIVKLAGLTRSDGNSGFADISVLSKITGFAGLSELSKLTTPAGFSGFAAIEGFSGFAAIEGFSGLARFSVVTELGGVPELNGLGGLVKLVGPVWLAGLAVLLPPGPPVEGALELNLVGLSTGPRLDLSEGASFPGLASVVCCNRRSLRRVFLSEACSNSGSGFPEKLRSDPASSESFPSPCDAKKLTNWPWIEGSLGGSAIPNDGSEFGGFPTV